MSAQAGGADVLGTLRTPLSLTRVPMQYMAALFVAAEHDRVELPVRPVAPLRHRQPCAR